MDPANLYKHTIHLPLLNKTEATVHRNIVWPFVWLWTHVNICIYMPLLFLLCTDHIIWSFFIIGHNYFLKTCHFWFYANQFWLEKIIRQNKMVSISSFSALLRFTQTICCSSVNITMNVISIILPCMFCQESSLHCTGCHNNANQRLTTNEQQHHFDW